MSRFGHRALFVFSTPVLRRSRSLRHHLTRFRSSLARIDAHRPCTARREEEEDEHVEERELAAVLDRGRALRQVSADVRDDHLHREDHRDRTDEQSEHEQQSATELEDAGEAHERRERCCRAGSAPESAEHSEELLQTVLHEEKASADPKDRNR